MNQSQQIESDLAIVVQETIGRDDASITDVLRCIAKLLGAFGCVLWDIVPGADLTATPPKGQLFVRAAHFDTAEVFAMHDLSLDYMSGQVVLQNKPLRGINGKNGVKVCGHAFMTRHNVDRLCSAPVQLSSNARGALTVYRQIGKPEFTEQEQQRLETISAVVPALCQAIRNRLSLQLLQKVEVILQDAERQSKDSALSKDQEKGVLLDICNAVAEVFKCLEVSVFLEDRLERKKVFGCRATTCPEWEWVMKREYRGDKSDGLTGWVLATGKPVHFFDLARLSASDPNVQKEYPGLTWEDPLNLKTMKPEVFGVTDPKEQPPLSHMAAPCLVGDDVIGAIRCFVAKRGPYYYSEHEVSLLKLVAAQISQCWFTWLNRREVQQENEGWEKLVEGMGKLSDFVQNEMKKETPNRAQIFDRFLNLTREALTGGADICGIRLLDQKTNELYYATTPQGNWDDFVRQQIENKLKSRRFKVNEHQATSAGVEAFQSREVVLWSDVNEHTNYHAVFPGVKREVVAPIKVGDVVLGVLDARGTGIADFPSNATEIMALLGSQLGLFLHLATTVADLRQAETATKQNLEDLRRLREALPQTFQDLSHQLKTPLNQALSRASAAVYSATGETKQELVRIRGLCSKVNRVTHSIGLLADLANARPVKVSKTRIDYVALMKTLQEAAQDNELTVDPKNNIHFEVERNTFSSEWTSRILVDPVLLEQALNNLLDNAAKYSYANTTVGIYGGLARRNCFHITVVNEGLPIKRDEIPRLTEREYRGAQAKLVTQEGSGIGLWIVNHIMRAQGGELNINPTKPDGKTEIRLFFPLAD